MFGASAWKWRAVSVRRMALGAIGPVPPWPSSSAAIPGGNSRFRPSSCSQSFSAVPVKTLPAPEEEELALFRLYREKYYANSISIQVPVRHTISLQEPKGKSPFSSSTTKETPGATPPRSESASISRQKNYSDSLLTHPPPPVEPRVAAPEFTQRNFVSFPRRQVPQFQPRCAPQNGSLLQEKSRTAKVHAAETQTKPAPPPPQAVVQKPSPQARTVPPAIQPKRRLPTQIPLNKKAAPVFTWDITLNDDILVVETEKSAEKVVKLLMEKYKDEVHACDTEVADIDVKKESPVGHGKLTCFSIYCGVNVDFGGGKSRVWVDLLNGGPGILDVFRPYFENAEIKKIWHNYSFDKHILGNYGIKAAGFYADTMHLARLWDSARGGLGYSLEALTADPKVMDDRPLQNGKTSMKDLFAITNVKKDGSEGKLKVIPPVEELQTSKDTRDKWIYYSAHDSVCTWHLWSSLKKKLLKASWYMEGDKRGNMYQFYELYWRHFGDVLVRMEAEGMRVDTVHLAEVEKVALNQKQLSVSRFQKWASQYCPDAMYMNVCSDVQIRQILFGGTSNKKDPSVSYPKERTFKVPNSDNYLEPGAKTVKKYRSISLEGIDVQLPVETFTPSGWPAVSGAVLKSLAGNVVTDYDEEEDEAEFSPEASTFITSGGVEGTDGDKSEDLSAYGKAYGAFGGGEEGKKACMAIAALCELSSIDTLISNFIQPLQNGQILGPDGRVHCSLNINTETGRLSARRPNLQNQPALEKDRYKIRKAFIAPPGKSLIVADYGQLELRILAHMSGCKSMLEAFEAGGDFHSRTALNMYPHVRKAVETGEVLLEWSGEGKSPVPLLKDKFGSERRKAKMLNFSIAYGKTAMGLSKDWKVSLYEAQQTLDLWYNDRSEVKEWQTDTIERARITKRVHTLLGRSRHLPDINTSISVLRGHLERAAINTPVQGSAADVAMCAMLEIDRNSRLRELGWKLILQVHDEVILEGPSESVEEAQEIVVKCMSFPFEGENFLKVNLDVDADHAKSWYEAK
ncbi:DNA polymerase I A, chloroplastic/mitochondrial [Selaginella moellendorffii]|uniref:DNA polymerase I A, chloroplastic/mitochondrial n=1 Tax=Selaginella moellendorffii TaxID=88036 RepID=UPI000D1C4D04|nr:DNA polymerase I A, chloroplastic/mitochondrial [Selaginella moellendorffii]|eukprot:XP_024528617.1 DNA polymerase I A, chloroplastic/mitochondrial [Selaginella moellendorffii]